MSAGGLRAALLLAAAPCEGGAGECHSKLSLEDENVVLLNGVDYQRRSYETIQDCYHQLNISAEDIFHTISHLLTGAEKVYAYRHLSHESHDSVDEELAPGCSMPVHESSVDLPGELKKMQEEYRVMASLHCKGRIKFLWEDMMNCQAQFPAYPFHTRLVTLFRSLRDAHTQYHSPLEVLTPWYWFGLSESSVHLRVKSDPEDSKKPRVQMWTNLNEENWITLAAVKTEDGHTLDPFQWLKDWADESIGQYRSSGARLNALLWELKDGTFKVPPKQTSVKLVAMREKDSIHASVGGFIRNMDVAQMSKLINEDPVWRATKTWLLEHMTKIAGVHQPSRVDDPDRVSRELSSAQNDGAVRYSTDAWQELPDLGKAAEALHYLKGVRPPSESSHTSRGAGRRLEDNDLSMIGNVGEDVIAYKATEAMVLEVRTFQPADYSEPFLRSVTKLYRKMVAEAGPSYRLILDLSNNPGGNPDFAYMLLYLVAPRHDTQEELCMNYRVLIHEWWNRWLESFGGQWQKLMVEAALMPADEIERRFSALESVLELPNRLKHPLPLREQAVRSLIESAKGANTSHLRHNWKTLLEYKDDLLSPARNGFTDEKEFESLVGDDPEDGWFPFAGNINDPSTSQPFSPLTLPFKETESLRWGLEKGDYSRRYMTRSCEMLFNPYFKREMKLEKSKFQWREIAILTNGLCGSTCSYVATKLQFSEGATVFTYGGVPGEQMDSSAFAGGGAAGVARDYSTFWKQGFYAAIIGDILYGPDTPVGHALRTTKERKLLWARRLPMPCPTLGYVTWNFHMLMIPELGSEALPREWYVIPAHKHYDMWPSMLSGRTSYTQKELWRRIQDQDWAKLRDAWREGSISFGCASDPPSFASEPPRQAEDLLGFEMEGGEGGDMRTMVMEILPFVGVAALLGFFAQQYWCGRPESEQLEAVSRSVSEVEMQKRESVAAA